MSWAIGGGKRRPVRVRQARLLEHFPHSALCRRARSAGPDGATPPFPPGTSARASLERAAAAVGDARSAACSSNRRHHPGGRDRGRVPLHQRTSPPTCRRTAAGHGWETMTWSALPSAPRGGPGEVRPSRHTAPEERRPRAHAPDVGVRPDEGRRLVTSSDSFSVVTKPTGNLQPGLSLLFFLSKGCCTTRGPQTMSEGTLGLTWRRSLESSPDGEVTMLWRGGNYPARSSAFRTPHRTVRALPSPRSGCVTPLQTNGTLVTEEWSRFFADHGFPGERVD